jgi:uncharacterized protein (DUF302 family)
MSQPIAFKVKLQEHFDQALERVAEALKEEGFGVLTEIDVRETLKAKLGEDFRPYVILGACNPPLAHRALTSVPDVGILLPCNVTVEEWEGGTLVSLANPEALLMVGQLGENADLQAVAKEAKQRLARVAEDLEG